MLNMKMTRRDFVKFTGVAASVTLVSLGFDLKPAYAHAQVSFIVNKKYDFKDGLFAGYDPKKKKI